MDAILSTNNQVDDSSLLELPKSDLVQLVLALKEKNKRTEEEWKKKKKRLEEKLAKKEEELTNVRQNRYVVDPLLGQDRDGDYDLMEATCSKWSVDVAEDRSDIPQGSSANLNEVGFHMLYSVKDRKHVLSYDQFCQVPSDTVLKHIVHTGSHYQNPKFKNVWKVISSANLLYRLCCLFKKLPVDIEGPSKYKLVWTAYVKHKASGKVFGFSEWKGATTYLMPTMKLEDEWVDDWIELLDLLCSDHCPHPYDGLVAGGVA